MSVKTFFTKHDSDKDRERWRKGAAPAYRQTPIVSQAAGGRRLEAARQGRRLVPLPRRLLQKKVEHTHREAAAAVAAAGLRQRGLRFHGQ